MAQGVGGRVKGTNIVNFIKYKDIPKERQVDVTYGKIVVDFRTQKDEKNCTCFTVGINFITYLGYFSTQMACLFTTKLFLNSVVSTAEIRFTG